MSKHKVNSELYVVTARIEFLDKLIREFEHRIEDLKKTRQQAQDRQIALKAVKETFHG